MTRFITLGDGGSQVVSKPVIIIIIYDWSDVIFIGFVDVEVVNILIPMREPLFLWCMDDAQHT